MLIEHHNKITGVNLVITSIRIYVSVVNLSMNNKIKLLEDLKERFERAIFWNKYRSETATQPKQQQIRLYD